MRSSLTALLRLALVDARFFTVDVRVRPLAALTALLLAAGSAWGQEPLKALGFTFGEPPPEDAALEVDAGRYKLYRSKHRWCWWVRAITDNNRVLSVSCEPRDPERLRTLLIDRHGEPHQTDRDSSKWLTANGMVVTAHRKGGVRWIPARTAGEYEAKLRERLRALEQLLAADRAKIAEDENAEDEDF